LRLLFSEFMLLLQRDQKVEFGGLSMKTGERLLITALMLAAMFISAGATDRLVLTEMFTNTE